MEARFVLAWLFAISAATSPAVVTGKYHSDSVEFDVPTTSKKTNLHFFLQTTISGDNPSTVLVARPNGTAVGAGNPTPFGTVYVFDAPLTECPDPKSKVIGNARGLTTSTSRGKDATAYITADYGFTCGEFNGSSITLNSRNPILQPEREMTVVGGVGKFRMARGFAMLKTNFRNLTTGDAIIEYTVTVFHN